MASTNTLCKKLLNVKTAVVTGSDFYTDEDGVNHIRIKVRPNKWHENDCPFCHKSCTRYDSQSSTSRIWRGLDWGGTLVEVECHTHRIKCPVHGILVADVPWAYPGSGFTKDFDLTVGWLATYLPRSAVSEYMRIDWETVGRCVHRTLNDIEPERSRRLDGLVNIGIDETSYKKGHKYITVIVNHDTNTVVWAAQGHGKTVLESFYRQLTPQQLSSIRVVTGDGAKWITECVNEFTPDCERRVDPFHVVEWAMEALDEVRREVWREAYSEAVQLAKEHPRKKGRPKADDEEADAELKRWLWWASHSRIPAFKKLYQKIKRHKGHILNAIRLGMSNARIEATNNKIKLIIRKAYGFRNIQNMLDMVYLVCSDLRIPLPNRKPKTA